MKHIVIIGGGFGGIRCALDIANRIKNDCKVTVIDRASSHVFTPALYEVASAYQPAEGASSLKLRQGVSISYSKIFSGKNIHHVQGEVISIDTAGKIVYIQDKGGLAYDYCVIAVGSQATDFGTAGVSEHAYFFKTIDDALSVNKKVHELFYGYVVQGSMDKLIQIIVVGAGFTGIELAAEIASCLRKLGKENKLRKKFFSIMLFEAAPQILPMISATERAMITSRLTKIGVGMSEKSPIESVGENYIKLADGHSAKGDMIIWTAGTKPSQLLSRISDLPLTSHGKVEVEGTLQVKGVPTLFALGDAVEFIDSDTLQPVPALAYTAIQQGRVVAKNIASIIKFQGTEKDYHKYLKIYKPSYNTWIAPVGSKWAIAHINSRIYVSGFYGWLIRCLVDLKYFISILPLRKALELFKKDIFLFSKND